MNAISNINLILEHIFNLGNVPDIFLIFFGTIENMCKGSVFLIINPCRRWYLFLIKNPTDGNWTFPLQCQVENFFNNPLRFIVNNDFIFDVRMSFITKWCMRTDVFSSSKLCLKGSFCFTACLFCMPLIEQVFERNKIGEPLLGVFIFRYSNISHMFFWKHKFQIIIHHDMFTTKTRKIFRYDAVHLAIIDILHHTLKIGAIKR